MNRVQAIVAAHGKTVIGWHEIGGRRHAGRVAQYWGTDTPDADLSAAVRRATRSCCPRPTGPTST